MTRSIDEKLEASMSDYFWAPDDVEVVDRPELGYASSPRDSVLFNCVFRTRSDGHDVDALVREVRAAHGERTSRWVLSPMSDSEALRASLSTHGYRAGDTLRGYAIHVDAYVREPRARVEVRRVVDVPTLRELAMVRDGAFGNSIPMSDDDFEREVAECAPADARVARFVAYIDGQPVGSAGLTHHPGLEFGFLWAGGVIESHRGLGAYTALLRARIDWAKDMGLEHVGLYAKLDTSAPIVAAHGFEPQGFMRYWDRPAVLAS